MVLYVEGISGQTGEKDNENVVSHFIIIIAEKKPDP